jgi:hypothetical protein
MLIDNKKNGKVGDIVKEHIEQGSKLSMLIEKIDLYHNTSQTQIKK